MPGSSTRVEGGWNSLRARRSVRWEDINDLDKGSDVPQDGDGYAAEYLKAAEERTRGERNRQKKSAGRRRRQEEGEREQSQAAAPTSPTGTEDAGQGGTTAKPAVFVSFSF